MELLREASQGAVPIYVGENRDPASEIRQIDRGMRCNSAFGKIELRDERGSANNPADVVQSPTES